MPDHKALPTAAAAAAAMAKAARAPLAPGAVAAASAADTAATAVPGPPWLVTPERGARRRRGASLDRDSIVAEALRIVDAEGIDALSIRRLAEGLGVTPMALYWHVRDKAELLELVGQAVITGVLVPDRLPEWRDDLRAVHLAMLEGFLRHPNATDVLAGRARFGGAGLRLFERILTTLLEAGFNPEAAFDAYQSLYLFTLGFMTTAVRTPEFRQGQLDGLRYMATLPETAFPSIRAVVPAIGRRPLDEQCRLGLDIVIEGIAARLR